MRTETHVGKLQEEYKLYFEMWANALEEEGPQSWAAQLAQTMLDDVREEMSAVYHIGAA